VAHLDEAHLVLMGAQGLKEPVNTITGQSKTVFTPQLMRRSTTRSATVFVMVCVPYGAVGDMASARVGATPIVTPCYKLEGQLPYHQ
jgi:hypothetical protein